VVQSRFAETSIVTLTRYLTLNANPNNPDPNPNFGESGFGELGRHHEGITGGHGTNVFMCTISFNIFAVTDELPHQYNVHR